MEWLTTTLVLDRLRDSDEEAWRHLTDRFRRPLLAFGRKMGLAESEAEDAAQETLLAFVDAYRAGRYDRSKGRLRSWLFGIAHRQALAARRRSAGRAARDGGAFVDELEDPAAAEASFDAAWEEAILRQCLDRVCGEVAASTYQAFRRVVLEHAEPEAVARELGVARSTVFVARHRVLKRIRRIRRELESVDA